jgi:hypothetical protein
LVGVAGFALWDPLSQAQSLARTGSELLREFFGTLCADFGMLCPIRSHFGDSTGKRESEERANYRALLARPKRFELLTPRFVVWCSISVVEGASGNGREKDNGAVIGAGQLMKLS